MLNSENEGEYFADSRNLIIIILGFYVIPMDKDKSYKVKTHNKRFKILYLSVGIFNKDVFLLNSQYVLFNQDVKQDLYYETVSQYNNVTKSCITDGGNDLFSLNKLSFSV